MRIQKFPLPAETTHHKAIEEITQVLCDKTQNTDKMFFRPVIAYFLGKMASSMHSTLLTKDRGQIPVNIYTLALATSGYGKGHSVNILENAFLKSFRAKFLSEILPEQGKERLDILYQERLRRSFTTNSPTETDEEAVMRALVKEYERAGEYAFTFDSGTTPAVKQLRHKILMNGLGAINLQIDEIGLNLLSSAEVLTLFLELYDQGLVKQKLTKNTSENIRAEELEGKTPTNMLLFGTSTKLLDGGQTEDLFHSMLETGYARRCLFGFGQPDRKAFHTLTPEEIYNRLVSPANEDIVDFWATHFESLAAPEMKMFDIIVPDDTAIELLSYKIHCEREAEKISEHEETKKAELTHRYFKALKLAGAYAFVDKVPLLSKKTLHQAILLVEESGASFQTILTKEPTYAKLARYMAQTGTELTHADLMEALPFYKMGTTARNELMALATAWGYRQHIIVHKNYVDGIEFFRGETLKETDIEKMLVSYSDNFAYQYEPAEVPFESLHELVTFTGLHWANHHFENGHRSEDTVIPGFNMVVLDFDGTASIDTVDTLLKDYKFLLYTTKRHTEEKHRFRVVLPLNYNLALDVEEYREFVNNILQWLPVECDPGANQRSRKWLSHGVEDAESVNYYYNEGQQLLDALLFIPRTSKNEQYHQEIKKIASMDNLERWFAQQYNSGNRNNTLLKYAMVLADNGRSKGEIHRIIHKFNEKLGSPLTRDEINSTVMVTVAKKLGTP